MTNENSIVKSVLNYSQSQRIGIILFIFIVTLIHAIYCCFDFSVTGRTDKEQTEWLAKQGIVDSLKFKGRKTKTVIYPFNPNFISDFKGYKLGMSVAEIDRLQEYRKQNKFVNSAAEFQAVTKVSDSLLKAISPYFKFPDWVNNKKEFRRTFEKEEYSKAQKTVVFDINQASKEDLMKIYGIGDKISERILEQKQKLGAFVSMEQLYDIWGLSEDVISKLKTTFAVKSTGNLRKVNINNASAKELAQFPFFKYPLAKEIVIFRTMNGDLSIEDLPKIKGFPIEKIKIIALYLDF